jgi:hypothetical protein
VPRSCWSRTPGRMNTRTPDTVRVTRPPDGDGQGVVTCARHAHMFALQSVLSSLHVFYLLKWGVFAKTRVLCSMAHLVECETSTTVWDQPASKHMHLGYDISNASRSCSVGDPACLGFYKRIEISESDLADLFGLPESSCPTKRPAQNLHQPLHLPLHLPESAGSVQNQIQTGSFCIDGFKDFSI